MVHYSDNHLHTAANEERGNQYRTCVTEKSAVQQKQITESLLLLMQSKPFSEITVTQLCQHANISRRTFYYLFSNLTGALYALIDRKSLEKNGMSGLLLERMILRVLQEDHDVHRQCPGRRRALR